MAMWGIAVRSGSAIKLAVLRLSSCAGILEDNVNGGTRVSQHHACLLEERQLS